jgi:germination protein M
VTVEGGIARLQPAGHYSEEALAQIVYTLTQFEDIDAVEVDRRYTRADFEEQTPSVLVESPLPFAEVTSPITATGTANTFEATFHYTLTDTDGLIVDENFVTATSGTGTRGTFEFTTDEYTVPFDGIGALIVFERSAEDGSKMNIVEIPLRMSR